MTAQGRRPRRRPRVSVPFRGFRGLQVQLDEMNDNNRILVSVPFRGFRGLQGQPDVRVAHVSQGFQSPSGVLGVCRGVAKTRPTSLMRTGFQSPSGVLGVCRVRRNALRSDRRAGVSVPFRGFRGLQGCSSSPSLQGRRPVSVPFRGFRGLQAQLLPPWVGCGPPVSVPFRGFRGLQDADYGGFNVSKEASFQSPSGVLGVCRAYEWRCPWRVRPFQSPSGVLGVCRSGSRNPTGWCGCPALPGFLIPRAL